MKIFAILLLLIVSPVNAGVYKWTDKNGNVHYSDHAINPDKATELNIDIESSAGIANSAGDNRERDLVIQELEEDRKAREKNRQEKRIAQKKKQKRCARSKDNLRQYRNASAIYKLNSKGERVYYSKEERKAREKKLNQSIAKNCR
ncbi:MAG: DUF4124 domain-containing protein [Gammaproteobacteria bacterium]|nr:DUF4124 domain-containing protein [Gammaproteobacteria bacterium]